MSGPRLPPGPKMMPVRQLAEWWWRPFKFFGECARTYGDTFTLRLAGFAPMVVVTRPDDVREVFSATADQLHGGDANDLLRPVVGPSSLIVLDGPAYARHRRLLLGAMGPDKIAPFIPATVEATRQEIATMPRDRPFPLLPVAERIMMHTLLHALMGIPREEVPVIHAAVREVLDAGDALILFLSKARWGRGRIDRAIAELDRLIYGVIARRRASARGHDAISLLLDADDGLSDSEIRDELVTLIIAGFETTSAAMCWAVAWMAGSPERAQRAATDPAYLDAAIRESMRLRPIFSFSIRRVVSTFDVAGYTLPAGVEVTPCIYLTHRRPEIFPDPEQFRPERFLEAKIDPWSWYPFGGGYRRCVGMALAMQILTEALRVMFAEVHLERLSRLTGTRRHVLIVPDGDCRVRVR